MARVRAIPTAELPPDLASLRTRFNAEYGSFDEQLAVLAHVPAALRHLPALLLELREAATLPRRYLELAIVVVSRLNACHYCVAHHAPFLVVEGLSPAAVDAVLDPDNPELDETDRLVVEWAREAWERSGQVRPALFARLRARFTDAEIVELTLRIALCGFFNRFNDALGIGTDAP